jgi:hypothetical protein
MDNLIREAWLQWPATTATETFSVLVGPQLTRRQFIRAIATASLAKTQVFNITANASSAWNILNVDADWDDESGQVELRIDVQVSGSGGNQGASINGLAFHVTILAAVTAA